MNEEIKLKDDQDIITTNLAWTVKKVELFGAIMAFSRRENSNVNGLQETQKIWSSNKSKPNNDENFSLYCKSLGIESSGIITCRQVHGDRILICKEVPKKLVAADAIIATAPGLYPLIRTADCVPILIIDRVKKISAAIHAGWKGNLLDSKAHFMHLHWFPTWSGELFLSLWNAYLIQRALGDYKSRAPDGGAVEQAQVGENIFGRSGFFHC